MSLTGRFSKIVMLTKNCLSNRLMIYSAIAYCFSGSVVKKLFGKVYKKIKIFIF